MAAVPDEDAFLAQLLRLSRETQEHEGSAETRGAPLDIPPDVGEQWRSFAWHLEQDSAAGTPGPLDKGTELELFTAEPADLETRAEAGDSHAAQMARLEAEREAELAEHIATVEELERTEARLEQTLAEKARLLDTVRELRAAGLQRDRQRQREATEHEKELEGECCPSRRVAKPCTGLCHGSHSRLAPDVWGPLSRGCPTLRLEGVPSTGDGRIASGLGGTQVSPSPRS
jgi:hypothetical protein